MPIAPPPLLLENSVVSTLHVEAQAERPRADTPPTLGRADVAMEQHPKDPSRWKVVLDVHIDPDEEHPSPYRVRVCMHGLFRLAPGISADEATNLLAVTGASILYSAARELLLLVTGRGPWGPWQLPTIRFTPPTQSDGVGANADGETKRAATVRSAGSRRNRGKRS